jgi:hypothetical protein
MRRNTRNLHDQEKSISSTFNDLFYGRYVNRAEIYFAHNEFQLDSQDIVILEPLREQLKIFLDNEYWVYLDCHGHASAPGKEWYNQELSNKRCLSVLEFFNARLTSYKRYIPGKAAHGEAKATGQFQFERLERKVIVRVKLIDPRDPAVGYQRSYITRVKIFKLYSGVYREWRNRGLFYLIEDFEILYETSKEADLKIKPHDIDKVFDILQILLPSNELNQLFEELRQNSEDKSRIITYWYHLLYRRIYQHAYDEFSRITDAEQMAKIIAQTY